MPDAMKLLAIAAAALVPIGVTALFAFQDEAQPVRPRMTAPPVPAAPAASPDLPLLQRHSVSPVSEAQYQRFVASLPEGAWDGPPKPDAETVKRLIALNPGKEARIEAILGAFDRCAEPAAAAAMDRVYRLAVKSPLLGAEKIERLTAFYSGGGWAPFVALRDRIASSKPPAAADLAEMERLTAAYPLADYSTSLTVAALNANRQGAFKAHERCEAERNAELAKAGVQTPAGSAFRS